MGDASQTDSRFDQKLDRAVFATYFVGAVIPLLLAAIVTHQFAVPALLSDTAGAWTLIGALMAVGLLSLSAFLILRRLIHRALGRMKADNERLGQILRVTRVLSDAPHSHVVAEIAAHCAIDLSAAEASFVFLQSSSDKALALCESAGDDCDALFSASEAELDELVEQACASAQPVIVQCSSSRGEMGLGDAGAAAFGAAVAMPLVRERGAVGALLVVRGRSSAPFASDEVDALATLAGLVGVSLKSADLQDAQRNFFTHVTELLVSALDVHVGRRAGHATRVAQLANRLGRELQMTDERMQRLHFSALLHDIGMLRIPGVHHGNFAKTRNHPVLGHRMLSRIRLWADVAPVVLHHHENFDGSGLPDGLADVEIPLESRVIHVVDVFDRLVAGDSASQPLSPLEALRVIQSEGGSRLDPEIVGVFAGVVERGELPDL